MKYHSILKHPIGLSVAGLGVAALSFWAAGPARAGDRFVMSSPAGERPCEIAPNGETVIPNGRLLTPAGRQIMVAPYPFGLTPSPNGNALAAVSGAGDPVALTLISGLADKAPLVRQIPPSVQTDDEILAAAFMGAAFSPDGNFVYVSGGNAGCVHVFSVALGRKLGVIDLNGASGGRDWADGFIGELAITRDGKRLFAVDQANFRLVIVDLRPPTIPDKKAAKKGPAKGTENAAEPAAEEPLGVVSQSIPVGRNPFAVTLSADEKTAYVANIGMFEYSAVPGLNAIKPNEWMKIAPFGFNTPQMRDGVKIGDLNVPGLGDPNAPESFSIWRVDVGAPGAEKVTGKVKTGVLCGQVIEGVPAVGGSNPNSIAVTEKFLYVSNGSNDTVSIIDAASFEVAGSIPLRISEAFGAARGQIPFGLALSPDGRRLYVAEAGINAVAVIDAASAKVLGHIPTAWFPSRVVVSRDGRKLYVSCAKGYGAGPNGGKGFVPEPGATGGIGELMKGAVGIVDAPADADLPAMTAKVIQNLVKIEPAPEVGSAEPRNPVPPLPGAYPSPIKHVVYITKENRTYDQIFGEYEKGNGDPTLANLGMRARAAGKGQPPLEGVNLTPNHQALARRYAISDNFYCDSDHSNDGHRWLVGTFPNVWTETATKTSPRKERIFSSAPGRRLMTGSSGAIYPEDYNEAGSIWEHLNRNGVEFFNFGLGFEFAGSQENDYPDTGIRIAVNYPMPAPLFERTSRNFPTYNTSVPDQVRVNHFEAEFKERWLSGKEPFPPVITMMLPNDHGAGENAERGYPYRESYMADNDLALGRVVEILSRSPWWKETVVIVTEDDAQGGMDHVDHHRSILMVIGPWARPGYVSRRHVSFGAILKTIFLINGLGPLNQYDAAASTLSDCFAAEPDPGPYNALPEDPRVFDPQKALDHYDEKLAWKPTEGAPRMDDPDFTREERERAREKREK